MYWQETIMFVNVVVKVIHLKWKYIIYMVIIDILNIEQTKHKQLLYVKNVTVLSMCGTWTNLVILIEEIVQEVIMKNGLKTQ